MNELYRKYRPKTLKDVLGQDAAVKVLSGMLGKKRVPHALLFSGPSGCGKTTMARILRRSLDCSDTDFVEVNCADFRGIDMIREIRSRMSLSPISGTTRIWLIDEAHQLTTAAQDALLKILEDTPGHVYFFLATTDPQKLKVTIRTRCTDVTVKLLTAKVCDGLLRSTAKKAALELEDEVFESLVTHAEGSARRALVLLNSIMDIEGTEEQVEAIAASDVKKQAIEIARALLNPRTQWTDMSKLLKEMDEEPESIRWMVLGYMTNVVVGGGKMAPRAYICINCFRDNFYDSKKAGLVAACWEVIKG